MHLIPSWKRNGGTQPPRRWVGVKFHLHTNIFSALKCFLGLYCFKDTDTIIRIQYSKSFYTKYPLSKFSCAKRSAILIFFSFFNQNFSTVCHYFLLPPPPLLPSHPMKIQRMTFLFIWQIKCYERRRKIKREEKKNDFLYTQFGLLFRFLPLSSLVTLLCTLLKAFVKKLFLPPPSSLF